MDEDDDRRVAEWYDTLSTSYDELYNQEQSPKHRAVIEFIANERIKILVDVGCGPGTFLERAQELYRYAVGIDLSINMLRTARKRRTGNTDFVLATSRLLPLKNESVDCLVSISTLRADSNLPALVGELKRVCRKNAVLAVSIFQDPEEENPQVLADPDQLSQVSDMETAYFLRLKSAGAELRR